MGTRQERAHDSRERAQREGAMHGLLLRLQPLVALSIEHKHLKVHPLELAPLKVPLPGPPLPLPEIARVGFEPSPPL